MVKNLPVSPGDVGDLGSIPGWGRSPGGGNGNLSSSRKGNSPPGILAIPPSILVWEIPWTGKPGGLQL